MPAYDYQCQAEHTWTEYRTINKRNASSRCPRCGERGHKVMTAPAIHCVLGYYDENLSDTGSGEPFYVSSPGVRERRRKELGLTGDAPLSDGARETKKYHSRRPVSVSG